MTDHQPPEQTTARSGSPSQPGRPDRGATTDDSPRRRGRRRRVVAGGLTAAVAVLAALASTAIGANPARHHRTAAKMGNLGSAYVRGRVLAAAAEDRDLILASISTFVPNGTTTAQPGPPEPQAAIVGYTNRTWSDPVTDAMLSEHTTSAGVQSVVGETLTRTPGRLRYQSTELDYPTRTWYSYTHDVAGSNPPTTETLPEWLLRRSRCPYTVTGQATIDGQRTLVMAPENTFPGVYCGYPTIWVNATTYQLVQTVTNGVYGTTTVERQWLPRTPANIALTLVQIPTGFTESASVPPFDPSGY